MENTILVVADLSTLRELILLEFETTHYECFQAGSASEALSVIARSVPDIAIITLRLPGTSGLELIEYLRRDHPEITIVALASSDDTSAIAAAQRLGVRYLFELSAGLQTMFRVVHDLSSQTLKA